MPELEFLLLCDYVRFRDGLIDIIGGGVDAVSCTKLPTEHRIGVAARLLFSTADAESEHTMAIWFRDPTGRSLTQVKGTRFARSKPTSVFLDFNLSVRLQSYGLHTVELEVDDVVLATRDVTVKQE